MQAVVAKASGIRSGELTAVAIDGKRIAVANANGQYYAFDEMCTHEQCSLVDEGDLEGTVLTCSCHGAQFDIETGRVLAPPAVEPLKVYAVRMVGDALSVEV